MEPAFHRGDLLFLTNRIEDPIRVGEIVVFRIEGREIPIVHRVLKIHEKYVENWGGGAARVQLTGSFPHLPGRTDRSGACQ